MSIPNIDPGGGGAPTMAVKLTESLAATYPKAKAVIEPAAVPDIAATAISDPTVHRIPPGAETGWEAIMDLPNDIGDWFSGWLDDFDMTGPILGIANLFTGGMLQWVMVAFMGLRIFTMGRSLMAPPQYSRGPVSLTYYRVPTATADPVVAYLQKSAQVEVRETVPDGEHTRIGVPIYHTGKADRGLDYLRKKADLEYTKI
jgi:hypothetical protein